MAQPRIDDDIKFLLGEIKIGLNFLRGYFKEKNEDSIKARKVALLEYGPFNGLKLLGVIVLVLWLFVTFSLWRFETTLWVTLFFGILLYDIIFQKEWITPFFVGVGTVLWNWGKDFMVWLYGFGLTTITDLGVWIWEVVKSLASYLYDIAKEIVVGIVEGTVEFAKDIIVGVFTTLGEIVGIGAKPASKE